MSVLSIGNLIIFSVGPVCFIAMFCLRCPLLTLPVGVCFLSLPCSVCLPCLSSSSLFHQKYGIKPISSSSQGVIHSIVATRIILHTRKVVNQDEHSFHATDLELSVILDYDATDGYCSDSRAQKRSPRTIETLVDTAVDAGRRHEDVASLY